MRNFPPLTADMVNADWKDFLQSVPKHRCFGEYLIEKYLAEDEDCPRLRWSDTRDIRVALTRHVDRTQVIPVVPTGKRILEDYIPF